MIEGSEKKRYGELMTEHERLVNDKDIKAYEDMDTNNLYGKLPGFGGVHEAQRQKQIVQRTLGNASPAQFSSKADVFITGERRSMDVAGRHSMSPGYGSPQQPNGLAVNKAKAQRS